MMRRLANITVEHDVPAVMRDGITLYSDIYRPDGTGPFPVLLIRQPYDKSQAETFGYAHPFWYARQGYIVVSQDCRGRYKSEGEFYPYEYESSDGYDSVEWAAALPGASGKVGMYGFSYGGATQLLAAVARPPHLTCICPAFTASQYYEGWAYNGGAFALAFNVTWAIYLAIETARRKGLTYLERDLCQAIMGSAPNYYCYLPLNEFPLLRQENIAPYFFDWLRHDTYDNYWKQWSIDSRYLEITVPALHVGGWYDIFRDGTLENFRSLMELRQNDPTRGPQKLVMGPWYHTPWARLTGQLDFGEEACNSVDESQLRWFDYWLKGLENGILDEPSAGLFVMGENSWKRSDRWPPEDVTYDNYYFHSRGRANSLNGDGTLDRHVPNEEDPDIYLNDPRFPIPSIGGHSCCIASIDPMGPADQREVEVFNEMLVYTSEPLQEDLTVAGPVTARLWAASSAKDADFTVKLVDVYPDGRAMNLTEGILRARYRNSLESPELLVPDEVYSLRINVGNTCHKFKSGHRVRVEVCSSNFPHWDRNTNTGNVTASDTFSDLVVATQVIFHDSDRPSCITLPILR